MRTVVDGSDTQNDLFAEIASGEFEKKECLELCSLGRNPDEKHLLVFFTWPNLKDVNHICYELKT